MIQATEGPTPNFIVSDEDKEAMIGQMVAQTIFSLDRLGGANGAPLADDFHDLFARGIAAMIAADTNIQLPQDLSRIAETVMVHVLRNLWRYHAEQQKTGVPALRRMLADNPIPEEMKRSWNNS